MTDNGLYRQQFEHDACGIGAVVKVDGVKSHTVVDNALSIVEKLEHRAGKDAAGETGDGVGILVQISHKFFSLCITYLFGITLHVSGINPTHSIPLSFIAIIIHPRTIHAILPSSPFHVLRYVQQSHLTVQSSYIHRMFW